MRPARHVRCTISDEFTSGSEDSDRNVEFGRRRTVRTAGILVFPSASIISSLSHSITAILTVGSGMLLQTGRSQPSYLQSLAASGARFLAERKLHTQDSIVRVASPWPLSCHARTAEMIFQLVCLSLSKAPLRFLSYMQERRGRMWTVGSGGPLDCCQLITAKRQSCAGKAAFRGRRGRPVMSVRYVAPSLARS